MRTCAVCNTQSADDMTTCPQCGSDLTKDSLRARSLSRLRENLRVSRITVIVYDSACPACRSVQGTYEKDEVPDLPVEGCSCPNGCTCNYLPVLADLFP